MWHVFLKKWIVLVNGEVMQMMGKELVLDFCKRMWSHAKICIII